MNAKALHKLSWRLLKLRKTLEEASKKDLALRPFFDSADVLCTQSYKLADVRALAEAKKADRGAVLWPLYFPREYAWEERSMVMRTPRTRSRTLAFTGTHTDVRRQEDAWSDLADAWPEVNLDKVTARAALVYEKPREFWCQGVEA